MGAYIFWNNLIYLEGTVYRTAANGITEPLGAGTPTDTVVHGAAPYWRLALEQRWKNHFFTIGTYGMQADIFPSGNRSGPADRFTDIAFDAQYQFMGTMEAKHMQEDMQMDGEHMAKAGNHIITAHATWVHENQDWKASFPLGNTAKKSGDLNTFKINGNYIYRTPIGDFGGSAGFFPPLEIKTPCFTPLTQWMEAEQVVRTVMALFSNSTTKEQKSPNFFLSNVRCSIRFTTSSTGLIQTMTDSAGTPLITIRSMRLFGLCFNPCV